MFEIQTLNKISKDGLATFDDNYQIADEFTNPDGVILRSYNMHETVMGKNLKAIARAGAGVNNIPVDKCAEQGIVVFNTPGANANAVKELVLAGLFLSSRKIVDAIGFAKGLVGQGAEVPKLVEKGKSQFAGPEIKGKTLGVIGLGAIGVMVANAAVSLGMEVIGYDPYISVDSAWGIKMQVQKDNDLQHIINGCDYISLHVPLNDQTRGMINTKTLENAKDGIRILNFARAELVNDDDMEKMLESGKVGCYVTDFPNERTVGFKNTVAIPHLGASTPESEENCAMMASAQLKEFLENGNITNSVNFPNCAMPREAAVRVTIAHRNVPSIITKITGVFGTAGINIENMMNKSKKDYAFTIVDTDTELKAEDVKAIEALDEVLKVRVIK